MSFIAGFFFGIFCYVYFPILVEPQSIVIYLLMLIIFRMIFTGEEYNENSDTFKPTQKCPSCGKYTKFRFHFNIPPGPKECYPNECLKCGVFCNYLGEIYKGEQNER